MAMNERIGYIGTYTKGDSIGIYRFILDVGKELIRDVQPAAQLDNPTYLTLNKGNTKLFAVVKEGDSGGVASFAITGDAGELEPINTQVLPGASPCHISVDSSGLVVSANYHKGTVEAYFSDIHSGELSKPVSIIQHEGSGPNQERQEKPHAHFAGFTPDAKYVVAVDLGIDKIITYSREHGKLVEVNSLAVTAGSGPRHLVFHPTGKYAYVMTELSNEVIVLQYNSENGSFSEFQKELAIPADFTENSQGSAIHISSDGRFLYAGNRGHDSIAVFRVDQETGKLGFIEHTHTEGHWPRDFVLDPSEKFLIASNQESNNLILYSRDETTGKLKLLQTGVTVPAPVCIKFIG
ncbi:lactonase family protein [Peribacillus sp. SCS-155]|uniref:lactonase family protein n=1 Tax=Peribacillus sedimenti TaxID=3115297 RepID=UPI00390671F1